MPCVAVGFSDRYEQEGVCGTHVSVLDLPPALCFLGEKNVTMAEGGTEEKKVHGSINSAKRCIVTPGRSPHRILLPIRTLCMLYVCMYVSTCVV